MALSISLLLSSPVGEEPLGLVYLWEAFCKIEHERASSWSGKLLPRSREGGHADDGIGGRGKWASLLTHTGGRGLII